MEELAARIEALVADRTGGEAQVHDVEPLPGGACQDLFVVELAREGRGRERMVLRSDAETKLPGSISREREFPVIRAAREAGVPSPAVRWLCTDLVREGASAYFMDWAQGIALGGKVTRSDRLAGAREQLPDQLADALAAVHRVTPATHPDLPLEPVDDPVQASLDQLRGSLDDLDPPHAGFELAYRWLDEHRPDTTEVTLVHGDYRTGNFMVDERGLVAVLDWEFTHWGSPVQDLGYLCTRDWRFRVLDKPVGGVAERQPFYDRYAEASGRPVDPAAVHWWEVFGNLTWGSGALYQTRRYREGERDFELLVIGRRAAEMAWEALRLIEQGS